MLRQGRAGVVGARLCGCMCICRKTHWELGAKQLNLPTVGWGGRKTPVVCPVAEMAWQSFMFCAKNKIKAKTRKCNPGN
jgi:hypothetical protein